MPRDAFILPFANRAQFDDGAKYKIELVITERTTSGTSLKIVGATKSGTFAFNHNNAQVGTLATERFVIPDFPLWVSVSDKGGDIALGNCIASLDLAINGDTVHNLCWGNISTNRSISYPPSPGPFSHPVESLFTIQQTANPAAGAQNSLPIPAGMRGFIRSMNVALTTSAAVANRRVAFVVKKGTSIVYWCPCPTVQTASTTVTYVAFAPGYGTQMTTTGIAIIPIPADLFVDSNITVSLITDAFDAGDDFSVMQVGIEAYPTI